MEIKPLECDNCVEERTLQQCPCGALLCEDCMSELHPVAVVAETIPPSRIRPNGLGRLKITQASCLTWLRRQGGQDTRVYLEDVFKVGHSRQTVKALERLGYVVVEGDAISYFLPSEKTI